MRRFFPVSLTAFALVVALAPASRAESIVDRPPMDVGSDQVGTITRVRADLLPDAHYRNWWFDAGVSYPVGELKDQNVDPGLMLRVNHRIWKQDALGLVGSLGGYFGTDSYFNDAQDELARTAPVVQGYSGVDIQSRYYREFPATLAMEISPFSHDDDALFFSLGPGMVWAHRAEITSAVNSGVGSVHLGGGQDSTTIGPGGAQYISPYVIRERTTFNLGWEARVGMGFRLTSGQNPLYMRIIASGTTYYNHTNPRTLLGFAASFSR